MIEIGRLAVKIAGRDAGLKCVIVDILDNNLVLIDGETRRRKCNIKHLELLPKVIKIKQKSDHAAVVTEFKKLGSEIKDKKSKKAAERPKKQKVKKEKPVKDKKEVKKPAKKAEVKEVTKEKKETVVETKPEVKKEVPVKKEK